MKKIYFLLFLIAASPVAIYAQTTHTISTSGLTFSPDSTAAHVGDQVVFNVDFSMHPLQEVSSSTWAANQTTALSGGFSASSGNTFTVTMTQAGTRYYVCTNHVGSGMKGRIFVSAANGIETIASVAALPYPNPAQSQLHLIPASSGTFSYAICDLLGQIVAEGSQIAVAQDMITVEVSAISSGTYILSMTDAQGRISKSKVEISH